MSETGFDRQDLADHIARYGTVIRVVIAAHQGSTPRECGAAILVWRHGKTWGQSGTIGGGALEYHAVTHAQKMLSLGFADQLERHALGPSLGQCCGGALQLLYEAWDEARLAAFALQNLIARPLPLSHNQSRRPATARFPDMSPSPYAAKERTNAAKVTQGNPPPLSVQKILSQARNQGTFPHTQIVEGWFLEPLQTPQHNLWVWGAGHVGKALISCLSPLPDWQITWVDHAAERFEGVPPQRVTPLWAEHPQNLVSHSPKNAHHVILTYSHSLDLEICHRLLIHDFLTVGLIGSATKWARFRTKLAQLGHTSERVAQITCPIGNLGYGKHPQAIALGVAAQLLNRQTRAETEIEDDNRRDASDDTIGQHRSSAS